MTYVSRVEAGLNPDFVDLLEAFAKAKVEFIVVEAHALAARCSTAPS